MNSDARRTTLRFGQMRAAALLIAMTSTLLSEAAWSQARSETAGCYFKEYETSPGFPSFLIAHSYVKDLWNVDEYIDHWRDSPEDHRALLLLSAQVSELAGQQRECLEDHDWTVRRSADFPLLKLTDDSAFSPGIEARLNWAVTSALSYLYSPIREQQDPQTALRIISEAMRDYHASIEEAVAQSRRYLAERRESLRKQQRWQRIGNAVGVVLAGRALDASNEQVGDALVGGEFEISTRYLEALSDLDRLEVSGDGNNWDEDGVRLTVLHTDRAFLPNQFDHTLRLLRIATPGKYCTGFSIARGLVVTNRHCVKGADERLLSAADIEVRREQVDFDSQTAELYSHSVNTYAVAKYVTPMGSEITSRRNDWAILYLDKEAERYWPSTISLMKKEFYETALSSSGRVAVAGYSGDLNDGAFITMYWGCGFSHEGGLIHHRCRTAHGSSGSPIVFSEGPFKGYIAGVNAAGHFVDGVEYSERNEGVALDEFRDVLEAAYREHTETGAPAEEWYDDIVAR